MKNLKEYIVEGIFDIENNIDINNVRDQIIQFLKENYKYSPEFKTSKNPNSDGKYEVSFKGSVYIKNKKITSLTNNLFVWTEVGNFNCCNCKSLISLEGAPNRVSGSFNCGGCNSLTSLEGAPEKVGVNFCCNNCNSLKTLKGVPKEVDGGFDCSWCKSLTSLKGSPKEVGGRFVCGGCTSLTSLKGASEKVGGSFDCRNCDKQFSEEDVKKVSDVKGEIYC